MLSALSRVRSLCGPVNLSAPPKRRGQMRLRPQVQGLESRALLSFSVNAVLSISATISDQSGNILNQQTSTSNPGSAQAAWQGGGGSLSAQGSGSFLTTESSLGHLHFKSHSI